MNGRCSAALTSAIPRDGKRAPLLFAGLPGPAHAVEQGFRFRTPEDEALTPRTEMSERAPVKTLGRDECAMTLDCSAGLFVRAGRPAAGSAATAGQHQRVSDAQVSPAR